MSATRLSLAALGPFAAMVLTGTLAHAQVATGYAIDRFNPSERGSEWFEEDSLDLRGHNRPAFGVGFNLANRPLVIYNGDGSANSMPVAYQLVFHPSASLVLWERLRVAFDIPVAAEDGTAGSVRSCAGTTCSVTTYPAATSGPGDVRLSVDVRLFGTADRGFTLAAGVQTFLPTGSRNAYLSDGEIRVTPRVAVAGNVGVLAYAAHVGFQIRPLDNAFPAYPTGSELDLGGSLGVRLADRRLLVGPEIDGGTVVTNGSAIGSTRQTPFEGLLGVHYAVTPSWRIGGGMAMGITRGFGEPLVRGVANVEWVPPIVVSILDRDHDGVPDSVDACPGVPGVPTDDPKTNGCPADRDHDGVVDSLDACPDAPGVPTDDPKTNGCPGDRDHDGILDAEDACPDVPGVATSDPNTNGCPADTDGDGIPDSVDACPDKPGPSTDDPKTNGCPLDPDRDKDGIGNVDDACPEDAGPKSLDPQLNGCPIAYVRGEEIRLQSPVKFVGAAVAPGPDGEGVLEIVVKTLVNHPEIKHLRVEGHTDNQGRPEANRKLSQDRAASVAAWLVKFGIEQGRLSSVGFGGDRPIKPNTTEAGRRANRRVEFHIEP